MNALKIFLLSILWSVFLLGYSSSSFAQGFEWNMMTGGKKGTYIQIGYDVAKIAETYGLELNVIPSKGSIENIEAVRHRKLTQFGIVQSDVLSFLRSFRSTDAAMRDIVDNTRIVFPLYNEEVHILARTGVNTLDDLNGARVGVGGKGSGTNLTASFILSTAGIVPGERVNLSAVDALRELENGSLDAFFYVAGVPASLFTELRKTKSYSLLPITDPKLLAYYDPVTITNKDYGWLQESVKSIAVKAVLMTYEYKARKNSYHRKSCDAVSKITYMISRNIDKLQSDDGGFHPKWKQVKLDEIPAGWERSVCVNEGLDSNYRLSSISRQQRPTSSSCRRHRNECNNEASSIQKRLCLMQYSECN